MPNYITDRDVIESLKQRYQAASIFALDDDPKASEVNTLSQLKRMMSMA
ncbi:hypothetical protein [Limnobaculum parvum]|nr:hypothetical protein [Limnobaculum parvum]